MYRLKARALVLRGSPEAAVELLQKSLAAARSQRAKALELRAATDLSALWMKQGRREDALELLAPICGWFSEGLETHDIRQAKVVLDQLR